MNHKNLWTNFDHLRFHDQVKFVIQDYKDYQYAKDICYKYHLFEKVGEGRGAVFPVFDVLFPQQLVTWILEDKLPVRLNLQIHKFIWSPHEKGV